MAKREFIEGVDYYIENGLVVYTGRYLMRRAFCCGNQCRHCPFIASIRGTTQLREEPENNSEKFDF